MKEKVKHALGTALMCGVGSLAVWLGVIGILGFTPYHEYEDIKVMAITVLTSAILGPVFEVVFLPLDRYMHERWGTPVVMGLYKKIRRRARALWRSSAFV